MIKRLFDWLDHRTGSKSVTNAMLFEHIPGGARWRYVWGSTLVFAFTVQLITGFFLWACYSPSAQTAWESVYYIEHELYGGWLLRGIHHFMAQAMIVLLGLHLAQVIIDGAYRAPREINFWIGLILMQIVLGLSLTGYLLPWDQKGYWATQVATNIMGIVPVIGPYLQRVLIGGSNYGHLTLTRFFALHAGLLPLMLMAFTAIHIYVFRRHGLTVKMPLKGPDASFWPDQILKDGIVCLAVMLVVMLLVLRPWIFSMGHEAPGAELGAPADPSVPYSAARPEWYFLFLFQFLKLKVFAGSNEIYGAIVIPSAVMLMLALMPILGHWDLGHRFNIVFFGAIGLGVVVLTGMAKLEDSRSESYKAAVQRADMEAVRAVELAHSPTGIPAAGAVALLRTDPYIQGPRLFSQSCASCHRYNGHDGAGVIPNPQTDPQSASDLGGFASRAWIETLLDPGKITTANYFGATSHKDGKMVHYIKDELTTADAAKKTQFKAIAAALSSEAQLKSQKPADAIDAATIKQGQQYLTGPVGGCTDCHSFHEAPGGGEAPDLTGFGSRQWLIDFINNPAHERFYGPRNDRMPAYGAKQLLDATQIGLIVDWLRGEWYDPKETAAESQ